MSLTMQSDLFCANCLFAGAILNRDVADGRFALDNSLLFCFYCQQDMSVDRHCLIRLFIIT